MYIAEDNDRQSSYNSLVNNTNNPSDPDSLIRFWKKYFLEDGPSFTRGVSLKIYTNNKERYRKAIKFFKTDIDMNYNVDIINLETNFKTSHNDYNKYIDEFINILNNYSVDKESKIDISEIDKLKNNKTISIFLSELNNLFTSELYNILNSNEIDSIDNNFLI